ncbi:MAG: phosphate regulon sensor histidine kinase PhoR, partial [Clostridia bacterium]|nr:phosphate regulon sensor histidine kinase PhoR [Clostridia bacterium]
ARIHKESIRLGSLISDMLMLSKIENKDATQNAPVLISLDETVKEIIAEFSEEIKKKNISTEIIGSASLVAEQHMIFELIENLVSNAIKYNKDNGSITVSFSSTACGITMQVKDTGIGIEKEHLPRLCERFYRVDKSHSKRTGGTGLGLAIVKHICAFIGAELFIESEFGLGSTFTVIFPTEK